MTVDTFKKILRKKPDSPVILHDLQQDPVEQRNLADSHPDVTTDLLERMNRIRFQEGPNRNIPAEK
ncbi:MAG: hypothetical protein VX404_05330 [Planctomycetota bacterium]|nr:hypothetical protein [Planctomycetota bacterium]